ncbi:hypothetical protein [Nocardioides piscis]|uniref:Uncharacterized protein n=1 Tax=Nocardioides piscis TaxID=2714938 RepID=A0A6G7YD05_9ACTN|nr:hypothetical protein [Nocardioides piscis]QIK74702.1 hypothetical protein G7071_03970 [Nocardioides piscis]
MTNTTISSLTPPESATLTAPAGAVADAAGTRVLHVPGFLDRFLALASAPPTGSSH